MGTTGRRVVGVGAAAVALLAVTVAAPGSASARVDAPGSFTGYGFDACTAPAQSAMDAWRVTSPFSAVGVYISGNSRGCSQPNLTRSWVSTQAARGWRLMPIHVGYQAPCFAKTTKKKMSSDPKVARTQGVAAATESVIAARALGIGTGRYLYLDMEWYDVDKVGCNSAVLSFMDGWSARLRNLDYGSGVYSSASAAIAALDDVRSDPDRVHSYHFPGHIWIGWHNGHANTDGKPYVVDAHWASHRRIHQYTGARLTRYGGVSINIDYDFLDVGRGSVAPAPSGQCHTPRLRTFTKQRHGDTNDQVVALKCLLKKQHAYVGRSTRSFGAKLRRSVVAYQRSHDVPATGVVNRRTWVILLAHGSRPLLKYGSTGQSVHRLQRSLTAALHERVPMTGVVDRATVNAVRAYRKHERLGVYSVVETRTWTTLQHGRH